MLDRQIEGFGKSVFTQTLRYKNPQPLKSSQHAIIGSLDFEYVGKRLLSVQLSIEGHVRIFYITEAESSVFGIKNLRELILSFLKELGIRMKFHGTKRHVYLASYYSTAELSMLHNFWTEASVRNVTPNVVNVTFPLKKRTTREGRKNEGYVLCSIIDVYHFFLDLRTATGKKGLKDVADEYKDVKAIGGKMSIEGIGNQTEQYWKEHMDKLLEKYPVEFEEYALQDVIITEALLRAQRNKIWEELGVDLLTSPTSGSIATTCFRTRAMSPGEEFGNTNIAVRKLVLKCSHGAVMVALKRGKFDNMYENDAKGFYSYSLRNMELLPRSSEDIIEANSLTELLSGYDGWGRVRFDFPRCYNHKKVHPSLPVQEYIGKKPSLILFPRAGISYCTVSEIRGAQSYGAKIGFIEGWYYREGTNKASEFAKTEIALREKAKEAGDKIGEGIHKSLPNHLVGKLFQNKGGFDIEIAKNLAEFQGLSISEVIEGKHTVDIAVIHEKIAEFEEIGGMKEELKLLYQIRKSGTEVTQKTRIGASWQPEWWSLILGRARAALWWVVNKYSKDPVHLSTDSYHDTEPLNEDVKTPFGVYPFRVKNAVGQKMYIARTKLYIHGTHIAHHAVHISDKTPAGDALLRKLIMDAVKDTYIKSGSNTLRMAAMRDEAFGERHEKEMQFDPRWDNKVKIEPDGSYRSWNNFEEYLEFVVEGKKKEKKENENTRCWGSSVRPA